MWVYFFLFNEFIIRVNNNTLKCELVKPGTISIMEWVYPDAIIYWKCLDRLRDFCVLNDISLSVPPIPYEEAKPKNLPLRGSGGLVEKAAAK